MISQLISLTLIGFFALPSMAESSPSEFLFKETQKIFASASVDKKLNWNEGDRASYKVDMGILKGTLDMRVREILSEGIWTVRVFDLGFAGKETTESLIDLETGETLRLIVNGREYQPTPSNDEVVEVKQEKVTVPAGTFDSVHALLRDPDTKKEFEIWVNPNVIPMSGMIKTVQPGQYGPITIVLRSYLKN